MGSYWDSRFSKSVYLECYVEVGKENGESGVVEEAEEGFEIKKTSMTAFARERKWDGSRAPEGERQKERRRYMKYAG